MWKKLKPYVYSILIALAIGGISAFLTRGNMEMEGVLKPKLTPPSFLFPIVWSVLYTLMGISSAIIYINKGKNSPVASKSLIIYAVSLFVNFLWSIIFFNLKTYLFAFIWLILLWLLIILTIINYKKINTVAAYLQIPYLLWVTFAGYLTYMIFILNIG